MYLLLGKSRMESCRYDIAIRLFERAQAQMRPHLSQAFLLVSLVSLPALILRRIESAYDHCQITGWKFDDLGITIRRQLCEALYATSHAKLACDLIDGYIEVTYELRQITGWKSDDLVQRDPRKALYAAKRAQQAGESLLEMTHVFNREVYDAEDLIQWVSGMF